MHNIVLETDKTRTKSETVLTEVLVTTYEKEERD